MPDAGRRPRDGRRLWHALAALPVAVALALAGGAASAQDPAPSVEEYGLGVVVGFGGRGAPVAWTPVEVRLAPDRPLRATLTVASRSPFGGTVYRESAAIEVGGGSAKAYRFVVPPGGVGVEVAESGKRPVRANVPGVAPPGFLVGRLGEAVDDTPPLRDDALGRNGTWVPVDAEWLGLGRALDSLDGLVAEAAAVADLSAASQRALASELVAGLDVVLVSGPGPVDASALGLPSGLTAVVDSQGFVSSETNRVLALTEGGEGAQGAAAQPDGDVPDDVVAVMASAGNGRLAITSLRPSGDAGAEAGRLWSVMLGARGALREGASGSAFVNNPFRVSEVFATGREEAPRIPWLAAFLVAYVVVVGPLNAVVLARARRRELAWLTVPVVTMVFTVAGFAAVAGGSPARATVGRATWWLDGAGRERVVAAFSATSDGPVSLELDDGAWAVRPLSDSGADGHVTRGDRARVTTELRALQSGGFVADRTVAAPAPMEVTARSEGRGVRVRVRNSSSHTVAAVEILAATARQRVGSLAPGENAEVLFESDHLPFVDPYGWEQANAGPPPPGQGRGPEAFESLLRSDVLTGSPGVAWAVGQRAGGANDVVTTAGGPAEDRGTLIAVGTTILPDAEGLAGPFAWHRAALTADDQFGRGPLHVDGTVELVLRFRPPLGVALGGTVAPDLRPGGVGGQPRWDAWSPRDGVWLPFDRLFPNGVAVPQDVLGPGGDLYVRAQHDGSTLDLSGWGVSSVPGDPP